MKASGFITSQIQSLHYDTKPPKTALNTVSLICLQDQPSTLTYSNYSSGKQLQIQHLTLDQREFYYNFMGIRIKTQVSDQFEGMECINSRNKTVEYS